MLRSANFWPETRSGGLPLQKGEQRSRRHRSASHRADRSEQSLQSMLPACEIKNRVDNFVLVSFGELIIEWQTHQSVTQVFSHRAIANFASQSSPHLG